MSNKNAITINGKNFVPAYGMKFFRLLSVRWGVNSINAVMARLACLQQITDDIEFEQIDTITDMIVASIEANPENNSEITHDEVDEMFLTDSGNITQIAEKVVKGFMDSLPKIEQPGKRKAAKK